MYCNETNETITQAFREDVRFVLYVASYVVAKSKEQERLLKQIRNKN